VINEIAKMMRKFA